MFRTVKYGLYAAVLAGLVSGTVAWTNVDKTVTLVVDGQANRVHTTAQTVGGVLTGAGYSAGPHDIVAPAVGSPIDNGGRIVYARGRLLHLTVDGMQRDVWTTAPTVAAALAQLGYSTADFTSVSRAKRLPLSPTDIDVRTSKSVTIVADGATTAVTTTDSTVGDLLTDLSVAVTADDQVSPAVTAPITEGMTVRVQRVTRTTSTEQGPIPFPTTKNNDPNLPTGQTQIVQAGRNGVAQTTWALVYVDGTLAGKTQVSSTVLKAPVPQVVNVGVGPAVAAAPAAPAPSPGSAQAIGAQLVAQRGWGTDQFNCLVQLWDRESGWNVHSQNRSSGAYGIPQALPGSKMGSAGPDWQNSAQTQITWGLGYIAGRYGTPCGAWSFWQNNGWY
ncbi:MAG: DUF348 domain-containing protein [Jatrophihabitans sp.]|nr:MAG: DUF348 domain-containing protein [Jatrophihabitans sp.]